MSRQYPQLVRLIEVESEKIPFLKDQVGPLAGPELLDAEFVRAAVELAVARARQMALIQAWEAVTGASW